MLNRGIAAITLLLASLQSPYLSLASPRLPADDHARALVRAAIEKIGGEAQLRSLKSLRIDGVGHTYFVEQSERPEGPWIVNYEQVTEYRDYESQRLQRTTLTRNILETQWTSGVTMTIADGAAAGRSGDRTFPGSAIDLSEGQEALALSPERVLLTALDARELRVEPDQVLQGVAQHVVSFNWRDCPVHIYLSSQTEMPTAVDVVRSYPDSFFWGIWGDVRTRTYLSLWNLEPGGLRYPRQWNVERNGTPLHEFTITTLTLNAPSPADSFSISPETKKAFESNSLRTIDNLPLGRPDRPAIEIVPGVVQIPGNWNATLVRQPDGVVIIEAPISSGYSDKVIAEAKKRFPGAPIKAVISTSDSWPHFGGIREYVARHIPVYALDLNRPILERLISSPHHSNPDSLERAPGTKAQFRIVSSKTLIGSGPNRLEIYPIRTETGERMLMVYFPEHKLLYGADLLQRMPDGSFFMPEYLLELSEAAQREKLSVERVFAIHLSVRPWAEIEAAISKAKAVN